MKAGRGAKAALNRCTLGFSLKLQAATGTRSSELVQRIGTPLLRPCAAPVGAELLNHGLKFKRTCRPLFVQFCANDPDTLLGAAKLVEDRCDAIDLNLGCPQRIARRGKYGAFLMDDLPLVERIVRRVSQGVSVPVTCKACGSLNLLLTPFLKEQYILLCKKNILALHLLKAFGICKISETHIAVPSTDKKI